MRALSIIGLVVFSVTLIAVIARSDSDPNAAAGWGIIGALYGISLAVVALVNSSKKKRADPLAELEQLHRLHEQGMLTEDEVAAKKARLLERL